MFQNLKNLNVTKLKMQLNSKTQRVTKLKNSLLGITTWHLNNGCNILWAAFCNSHNVLKYSLQISYFFQCQCVFILPSWYCVRHFKYFLSKPTHKHNVTLFGVYVGLLKSGSDPDNIIPVGQKNRLVGRKNTTCCSLQPGWRHTLNQCGFYQSGRVYLITRQREPNNRTGWTL